MRPGQLSVGQPVEGRFCLRYLFT